MSNICNGCRPGTCRMTTQPGRTVPSASSHQLKPAVSLQNRSISRTSGSATSRSSGDSPRQYYIAALPSRVATKNAGHHPNHISEPRRRSRPQTGVALLRAAAAEADRTGATQVVPVARIALASALTRLRHKERRCASSPNSSSASTGTRQQPCCSPPPVSQRQRPPCPART